MACSPISFLFATALLLACGSSTVNPKPAVENSGVAAPGAAGVATGADTTKEVNDRAKWTVARPHLDVGNPLAIASVDGAAVVGEKTGSAPLSIHCRNDADGAGLWAVVGVHKSLGFDVGPFEGPGGVGGSKRLLTMSLGAADASLHHVAGYWSAEWPETFAFSFSIDEKTIAAIIAGADEDLDLTVADAEGDGPALSTRFRLPKDSKELKEAVAPCL